MRPALMERGRFDVCVMAILKDEAPNMEEWLCHHMAIGVDHFFLYDNGSTDELHEVLRPVCRPRHRHDRLLPHARPAA